MEWPVDLSSEVILDPRRKKKWVDEKKRVCYMIYPRSLGLTSGEDGKFWGWEYFQESSGDLFEVAKLKEICWFAIKGRLNMSKLSRKVDYEAVFVVKLSEWAQGWDSPVKLKLTLPDGKTHERRAALLLEPRGKWLELVVGNFKIHKNEKNLGDLKCSVSSKTPYWKHGLTLKGLMIRPKN
ncbi:hypothetical protein ACH5RR_023564 [Cinchona calisaya]|uniref:Uncharacterized protein n=1 Tax=Cinchona calisaya TaxID=153742 RepID=A0ABD2ZEW8_9GENT